MADLCRAVGWRAPRFAGRLFAPGGIAVGRDGALYVTNNSILAGVGQVLRIDAPSE